MEYRIDQRDGRIFTKSEWNKFYHYIDIMENSLPPLRFEDLKLIEIPTGERENVQKRMSFIYTGYVRREMVTDYELILKTYASINNSDDCPLPPCMLMGEYDILQDPDTNKT